MIEINGNDLSIENLVRITRNCEHVNISEQGQHAVQESYRCLQTILDSERPVYGINTGFGIFAEKSIPQQDLTKLSRNLILSHAIGTGPVLSNEIVRAAMLIRANTLCKGYSGVRIEVVQSLLDMLNAGITPLIPSQGSLGSSGDISPLSHLALVFTTDEKDLEEESSWAKYNGQILSGKKAMAEVGLKRIQLGPKEGLAINNGATFSAAIAALVVVDLEYLLKIADLGLSMSLEALLGCSDAFDHRIHEVRGHPGQIKVAENIRQLIRGSTFIDAAGRVQDAYSLRCAPHVHGTVRDIVEFSRKVVEREINAATDNPLIFGPNEVISGGNFHGEAIGMAMDYLGIAITELASISERRIFRLTDEKLNAGLPPMLVDHPDSAGLNSGMMIPQYTAASLVLENRTLSTPDSVQSLPTSAEQEDHNANSMTAARNTWKIIKNTTHVLAIELYIVARAIDLRQRQMPDAKLGDGTIPVFRRIREKVPYQPGDAWWQPEIQKISELIEEKIL